MADVATFGCSFFVAHDIFVFILCFIGCQAAGLLGSVASIPNIPTWYAGLRKPAFNPPNWVFAPVWTLLYSLMAISLFCVCTSETEGSRTACILFLVQLLLNTIWSFLFFKYHLLLASLLEMLLMLAVMLAFTVAAWPLSRLAALCFLPYIAWVCFAALLNAAIWRLNRVTV